MAGQQNHLHHGDVMIHRDEILGHGAYGAVYKAKWCLLPCAAKVLHDTVVDHLDPGSETILKRFRQECEFMNSLRHPHIVQYLGVFKDSQSNLPVLLMELLEESLTTMLEHSQDPLPFHIQVDLCHDVSLALSYLHSNGILHRDLSSNNVLIGKGGRAKVTDFGMSRLAVRSNPRVTTCPGTQAYMPPEALRESTKYTEKLDVFSMGVIIIQVCTRLFPDPGPATREVKCQDSAVGTVYEPVPEMERRREHIDLIDLFHPLLSIAVDCIEYRQDDRPSSVVLCQRIGDAKKFSPYAQSREEKMADDSIKRKVIEDLQHEKVELLQKIKEQNIVIESMKSQLVEKDEELQLQWNGKVSENEKLLQALHQQLENTKCNVTLYEELFKMVQLQCDEKDQEIERLQLLLTEKERDICGKQAQHELNVGSKVRELCEVNKALKARDQTIEELQQQLKEKGVEVEQLLLEIRKESTRQMSEEMERCKTEELLELTKKVEDYEEVIEECHQANSRLAEKIEQLQTKLRQRTDTKDCLKWNFQGNAPCSICRGPSAIVEGNSLVYLSDGVYIVYSYNVTTNFWGTLPPCPLWSGSLAIVNGLLTMIGGVEMYECGRKVTNKLVSYDKTDTKKWFESLPLMPTKRCDTTTVKYGSHLIVAGGRSEIGITSKVEVLNTDDMVWFTVAGLPFPYELASAAICGDNIYMLGGKDSHGLTRSVLTCSLPALLHSCQRCREVDTKHSYVRFRIDPPVWQCVTDLPVFGSTCVSVQGQLLAIGGCDSNESFTSAVYRYDTQTKSWTTFGNMSEARNMCYAAVVRTNELIVIGGNTASDVAISVTVTDVVEMSTVM